MARRRLGRPRPQFSRSLPRVVASSSLALDAESVAKRRAAVRLVADAARRADDADWQRCVWRSIDALSLSKRHRARTRRFDRLGNVGHDAAQSVHARLHRRSASSVPFFVSFHSLNANTVLPFSRNGQHEHVSQHEQSVAARLCARSQRLSQHQHDRRRQTDVAADAAARESLLLFCPFSISLFHQTALGLVLSISFILNKQPPVRFDV